MSGMPETLGHVIEIVHHWVSLVFANLMVKFRAVCETGMNRRHWKVI
jgi:hypothetical protein